MTAFVLAGGLGTRIAGLFPDLPKAMIPVAGRPFIDHLLEKLRGFDVVLCAGHRAEPLIEHVAHRGVRVVVENRPLGTAGALAMALHALQHPKETFLALNGDTYAEFDPDALLAHHRALNAIATLTCYEVDEVEARGSVEIDGDRLTGFREKAGKGPGWVSGGVYALERRALGGLDTDRPTSLEGDVFPYWLHMGGMIGAYRAPGRFWDMGTPEGLKAAEERLS